MPFAGMVFGVTGEGFNGVCSRSRGRLAVARFGDNFIIRDISLCVESDHRGASLGRSDLPFAGMVFGVSAEDLKSVCSGRRGRLTVTWL